ncbi:F0F1 ATP synthase subunit delta [Pseudooceanicola sp. HF7]|uniref:F0F1 ATP synthase subunit delta n=1 Tax=Pseudooceanicola sp. HF7 TaxID=2721560 RepID=UPI00142FFCA9|nr:F0F1 ATP synthase subunit delta [Pseudooceanicola sp. HF7]
MSEPASISYGIASRYASAVFEISNENGELSDLETSVNELSAALDASEDLREVISSPLISRTEQGNAIAAVAAKLGLTAALSSTLGLMAQKRRLFALPQLVKRLEELLAEHKGEVTAEVTSAEPLTKEQSEKLSAMLAETIGKQVKLQTTVDESLIGGLVVKVGSRMVDTSIRSKLNALQNVMKEVG